jgi:transcriptional regulator with XRE-family HTH domain
MSEKRMPKQPPRPKNLTPFGRWIYDLKDYLGVPMMEIMRRAGMSPSTLSKSTRNDRMPERDTVEKLEEVLQSIAKEKGYPWPASELEMPFYNSASHATEGQIRKADQARRDIIADMVRRRDSLDKK